MMAERAERWGGPQWGGLGQETSSRFSGDGVYEVVK